MLGFWTVPRAAGIGLVAGAAALALWTIRHDLPAAYRAALAITAFCGLSVLAITAFDILTHRRGERMRAVRAFDIAVGLLLAAPSIDALLG